MATRVKEGVHLKEKSFSAPSTPGRTFLSNGRQTTADSPSRDSTTTAQEKPVPNYLKPTMSSCHDNSSRYPKSQHPDEDPMTAATARKRLLYTKSMEKPGSPSSLPHKTSKEKTPGSGFSLKPALSPKSVREKASKVPTSEKTLTRAKSLPKSMPKRREVNGSTSNTSTVIELEQQYKVISIHNGVQGHAARHGSRSPKSSEGKQWTTLEESDAGKPGAPRVKVTKKVYGNGVPRKLKFQQGRELESEGKEAVGERLRSKQSCERVEVKGEKTERENLVLKWREVKEKDAPPAYNDVIEEAATKLATRRSKVKALVGAFESVILPQEPESQPSQQQEVMVKAGRVGQPSQPKLEKEVKVGEESAKRDQPSQVKPKKEVKGGKECAKGGQPANQQPKKEVKGEEESGGDESKDGHLGQESQQKKEMKGEKKNGIEEE